MKRTKVWKLPTTVTLSDTTRKILAKLSKDKAMTRSEVVEWLVLSYVAQTPEADKQ